MKALFLLGPECIAAISEGETVVTISISTLIQQDHRFRIASQNSSIVIQMTLAELIPGHPILMITATLLPLPNAQPEPDVSISLNVIALGYVQFKDVVLCVSLKSSRRQGRVATYRLSKVVACVCFG